VTAGLENLYSQDIRDLAETVREARRLPEPQATISRKSPLCGSQVTLDVSCSPEGIIEALGYEVRACALGEAVTALVSQIAPGQNRGEISKAAQDFRDLLKSAQPMPEGPWKGLDLMLPAHKVRARHRSALLPFEALLLALAQIEAATQAKE